MEYAGGYRFILPASTPNLTPSTGSHSVLYDHEAAIEEAEQEWNRVHILVHASSIRNNDPELRGPIQADGDRCKHITFDVRKYLPQQAITEVAGLTSRRHDGRHPNIQRCLWGLLLEDFEANRRERRSLRGLGKLLVEILHHTALAMSQGFFEVLIELRCAKGRHRSVGTTTVICKILREISINADALMYDSPTREHGTRICTLCQRGDLMGCQEGYSQVLQDNQAILRDSIARHIVQEEHFIPYIIGEVSQKYRIRIELLQCRVD